MKKETIVLDTSLFVNPASAQNFGPTPTAAFSRFLELASRAEGLDLLMPPSVYNELMHFAEEPKIPKRLLAVVKKQPPKKHEVKIPGVLLHDLVESIRDRFDRGLRLAERNVREALQKEPVPSKMQLKKGEVRPDSELIGRLRESYRRIMREGMLDSKADVDLLLLAYEAKATLASADQGVLDWANNLGVRILSHDHLTDFLNQHLSLEKIK